MSFPTDPGALGGLMAGFQQQMDNMKAEAAQTEVTGQAGGGIVKVTANGNLDILAVSIDESAADDVEMLEDLVVAATNDALRLARNVLNEKMGALMGGLPLPPGMLGL